MFRLQLGLDPIEPLVHDVGEIVTVPIGPEGGVGGGGGVQLPGVKETLPQPKIVSFPVGPRSQAVEVMAFSSWAGV